MIPPDDNNGHKLHVLPTAGDEEAKKHKAAIETIARNLGQVDDMIKLTAKSRRMCFQALVDAGFDEDQAIQILGSALRGKGFLPSVI